MAPAPPSPPTPPDPPSLQPVLLVPGIGGTILCTRPRAKPGDPKPPKPPKTERAWVRVEWADYEFREKLWCQWSAERGDVQPLDRATEIVVPDDAAGDGLYAVDTLDPDVPAVLAPRSVYYFHALIKGLVTAGYAKGRTLFGYGYDFRQSNRNASHLDGLEARLKRMVASNSGRKVCIVSHSMGGLLVRSLLALRPRAFAAYVESWVAIAAPFAGAPGFVYDAVLTGVEFIPWYLEWAFVSKWSMRQMLVQCPSIYEMMPAVKAATWAAPPEVRLWLRPPAAATLLDAIEAAKAAGEAAATVESGGDDDDAAAAVTGAARGVRTRPPPVASEAVSSVDGVWHAPSATGPCRCDTRDSSHGGAATEAESDDESGWVVLSESEAAEAAAEAAAAPLSRRRRPLEWLTAVTARALNSGGAEGVTPPPGYTSLPCDDGGDDGGGGDGVSKKSDGVLVRFGPGNVDILLKAALADNAVDFHGDHVPLALDNRMLAWAGATRRAWSSARLPPGTRFLNVFGVGVDTPQAVEYGSQGRPLGDLAAVTRAEARFDLVDGDGTVPAESASADGLRATDRVAFPGEHKNMLNDPKLLGLLLTWLHVPSQ